MLVQGGDAAGLGGPVVQAHEAKRPRMLLQVTLPPENHRQAALGIRKLT